MKKNIWNYACTMPYYEPSCSLWSGRIIKASGKRRNLYTVYLGGHVPSGDP